MCHTRKGVGRKAAGPGFCALASRKVIMTSTFWVNFVFNFCMVIVFCIPIIAILLWGATFAISALNFSWVFVIIVSIVIALIMAVLYTEHD